MTRREFLPTCRRRHGGAAVHPQSAEPRLRQPGQRKQRLVVIFIPERHRSPAFWPDEEGDKFTLKEILKPLAAVSGQTADAPRRLRQSPRRRRRPHARHRLPADRHRTLPRQRPGRLGHPGRLGQRHLHRSGNQELPAERRSHPHALRLPRIRRHGAATGPTPGRAWSTPGRTSRWRRSTIRIRCSPNSTAACKDRETLASILDDVQRRSEKGRRRRQRRGRRLLDEHATFVREMEKELKASRRHR